MILLTRVRLEGEHVARGKFRWGGKSIKRRAKWGLTYHPRCDFTEWMLAFYASAGKGGKWKGREPATKLREKERLPAWRPVALSWCEIDGSLFPAWGNLAAQYQQKGKKGLGMRGKGKKSRQDHNRQPRSGSLEYRSSHRPFPFEVSCFGKEGGNSEEKASIRVAGGEQLIRTEKRALPPQACLWV